MSVLPAPSAFKPTLVSEYFFGDSGPAAAAAAGDLVSSPQSADMDRGGVQPTSSPEIDDGPNADDHAAAIAKQQSSPIAFVPVHDDDHDMRCEADGDGHGTSSADGKSDGHTAVLLPEMDGLGSPTHRPPGVATVLFPTIDSSGATSAAVSGHSIKIHQRLMDAAMADGLQSADQQGSGGNGGGSGQRKYSGASTTSAVDMTSLPSTRNTSTSTSPFSPMSDGHTSVGDTSADMHSTPSPPPLNLVQSAASTPSSHATGVPDVATTTRKSRAPNSSPPRYRTVPAAATNITPVQVPAHAQGAVASPVPYNSTQHAQTPKQPHTSAYQQHAATASVQSTAVTPQPQSQAQRERQQQQQQQSKQASAAVPDRDRTHSPPAKLSGLSRPIELKGDEEFVGPFILGPVLGRGCTGTVRLGTHSQTNFQVAFKIIEKKYLVGGEGGDAATDVEQSKLWAKVKREIVILKLIQHPHVLKLYDVLETDRRIYLVLEKSEGGELFDYIVSKGRLDRHEALRITAQIVMGLSHCHDHNICHRDLKPENLLLDGKKNIKIADFGMAQLMKKDGILKTSCGSPHYASPEIIEGSTYDAKCWAPGTLLLRHDGRPIAVERVKPGVRLMGDDCTPRTVQAGSLLRGRGAMFQVDSQADGRRPWRCNGQHTLVLRVDGEGKGEGDHRIWETTVAEFLAAPLAVRRAARLYQPAEVLFPSPSLPLRSRISSALGRAVSDEEAHRVAREIGAAIVGGGAETRDDALLDTVLDSYGSAGRSRFPPSLLTESVTVRRSMLAGVLSSAAARFDPKQHCYVVDTAQQGVVDDLTQLARGLGAGASRKKSRSRLSVHIWGAGLSHLSLPLQSDPELYRDATSSAFSIRRVEDGEFVGFRVDGNGRCLMADFVVTHNCTDVWSIGVILFALITGSLPFDHDNIPTLLTMVTRGRYTTPAHVPADIAHLISRMLTVDPTKRITIPEIKKHICFKGHNYFPAVEPPHGDGLARRSLAPTAHGAHAPAHKRHKLSNQRSSGCEADSDEERDLVDHAHHRKRGGGGGAGVDLSLADAKCAHGSAPLHPRSHAHGHAHSACMPTRTLNSSSSASHASSSSSSALDDSVIDEAVLADLESLGLGPKSGNRDELKRMVRASDSGKEPSLEHVFYKLLKQRKTDRLRELAVLSPKISPARPPARPRPQKSKRSSHHSSTMRSLRDESDESQPASAQGSALLTPNTAAQADMSGLDQLELPPPACVTAPGNKDVVMADAAQSVSITSGTSIMSNAPTPPAAAGGASPAMLQSSIFAPASALASSVLGMAAQHVHAHVEPIATKAEYAGSAMQVDVGATTQSAALSQALGAAAASAAALQSPAPSIVAMGLPAAITAACVVQGLQVFPGASPMPMSTPQGATPSVGSSVATPLPASGAWGSPPASSPPHVLAPPPMMHCYSDGAVPDSIMSEPHGHYYTSKAALPSIDVSGQHGPVGGESGAGAGAGVVDLDSGGMQARSPSDSSLASVPGSAPLSREDTAPSTPIDRMSASYNFTGTYETEEQGAGPRPSPPQAYLPDLPPMISSSANVSPMTTQRQSIFQRRMSTPQTHIGGSSGGSGGSAAPASARQLFDAEPQMSPKDRQQQAALDQLGRAHAAAAAGPSAQSMEVEMNTALSTPMMPQQHLISPPPLALPRVAAPNIHVRVGDTSSSSDSTEENDDASGTGRSARLAHPHPHAHASRLRAYSQDESNLLVARHLHPTATVVSNVRTPVLSPMGSPAQHQLPTYSTTPRFHRVKFHDQAGPSSIGAEMGGGDGAESSARMPLSNTLRAPPSPTTKKSWFSAVFGSASPFSLFDRLKGKRASTLTAAPRPGVADVAAAAAISSGSVVSSASPLMSPLTPAGASGSSAVISTKRATLTLTNELTRLFVSSGVQFTHSRGYKFQASYQPHLPATAFHTPPLATPLLQRAVSTPGEGTTQRPRSSSSAVEPMARDQPQANVQPINVVAAAVSTAIPSTPKPTPTHALNQPFVPHEPRVPMHAQYPSPISALDEPSQTELQRNSSCASVDSSRDSSSGDIASMAGSAMASPPTISETAAAAATPGSASSIQSSPPPRAAPRSRAAPPALFGPGGVRFSVDIQEAAHDTRVITIARKTGDAESFARIVEYVHTQLGL